jgi:hypothetical protein
MFGQGFTDHSADARIACGGYIFIFIELKPRDSPPVTRITFLERSGISISPSKTLLGEDIVDQELTNFN